MDRAISLLNAHFQTYSQLRKLEKDILIAEQTLESAKLANDIFGVIIEQSADQVEDIGDLLRESIPTIIIAGLAAGGDTLKPVAATPKGTAFAAARGIEQIKVFTDAVVMGLEFSTTAARRWTEYGRIAPLERDDEVRSMMADLGGQLGELQDAFGSINARIRELDDARRGYLALVAQGERIQEERLVFRQRTAAITQGYRTRDAAFRIFRNEKL